MALLVATTSFWEELDATEAEDPRAWDAAAVLIEDFETHQDFPAQVPSERLGNCPGYEVYWFEAAKRRGYDIAILKFLDFDGLLPPYRMFLGYHKARDTYYAIAYRNRSTAYDESPSSLGELFLRYEECGIPNSR